MTQPRLPFSNDPISVIEDLDPEPASGRGPGRRGELLLGVGVLLAVVLFALWQWWRQDYQSGQYRAGQEAAGRNDLDSALHYFSEASGYGDAEALARSTQEQITERDRLYESASAYFAKQDWLPALRDVRAAARIQPDYRDLKDMGDTSLQKVYQDALGGTITMREGANPPGLYYRSTTGWLWLEGSDKISHWIANQDGDDFVYDVPNPAGNVRPTPQPGPPFTLGEINMGRQEVAAHFDGTKLTFKKLLTDGSYYTPVLAGSSGFWGVHDGNVSARMEHVYPIIRNAFWGEAIYYLPYTRAPSDALELTATSTFTSGTAFAYVDHGSNRYLLAEWTGAPAGGRGTTADTTINLYLGAAGEATQRLVYTRKGGSIDNTQLSPDGRYMIVTARSDAGQSLTNYTTTVVDLESTAPPRILKEVIKYSGFNGPQALTATFVRRGAFAGKLVLAEYSSSGTEFSLIDPALATGGAQAYYTLMVVILPGDTSPESYWFVSEQNANGFTLAGQSSVRSPYSSVVLTSTLHLVTFDIGGTTSTCSVVLDRPASQFQPLNVQTVRTIGDQIVWSTLVASATDMSRVILSAYSMHPASEGGDRQDVARIFTLNDSPYSQQSDIYLGSKLLAYTQNGELHARTYDGQVDLLLENGITAIFENPQYDYYNDILH